MKTSSRWKYISVAGKTIMMLVLGAMIGSMEPTPALAKDGYKRGGDHDNRRYEERGRGHDRDRHRHHRRGHRPYVYRERYYAPPPVVYAPPPPPGFTIFFPPFFFP